MHLIKSEKWSSLLGDLGKYRKFVVYVVDVVHGLKLIDI